MKGDASRCPYDPPPDIEVALRVDEPILAER
jgi:hypothetical protein